MASCQEGTVVFASVGRSHYAFDVYSLDINTLNENILTDGISVNFNAQFVEDSTSLEIGESAFVKHSHKTDDQHEEQQHGQTALVYVSERTGASSIYINLLRTGETRGPIGTLGPENGFYYCDRPCIKDGKLIFVSTNPNYVKPQLRQPTTAVFSTCIRSGHTVQLTPAGVSDYSPALSPSKKWLMVASNGGKPWQGERYDLELGLWVFNAEDGSNRKLVVERGGWPTWSNEKTVFFHKQAPDDWWSIYKVVLPERIEDISDQIEPERVTPPGVHAFTPAASRVANWITVATRRLNTSYRHIELFNLSTNTFIPVTLDLHPDTHHFNPFVSDTSDTLIGYHRCRSHGDNRKSTVPLLHHVACSQKNVTLLRLDGAFPSISSDGQLIAYNTDFEAEQSGVMISKLDGSGRKRLCTGLAFGTCWNPTRPATVYSSIGHIFANEETAVHVVSIEFNMDEFENGTEVLLKSTVRVLTKAGTKNNAFPTVSPDGKKLVFRSGRSGHKNLYIMDALTGEEDGIEQLTEGPWVDTMPSWSPDGKWIAFSSTRDDPTGENFALYMVQPDGSGLHRLLPPADHPTPVKGRYNHVCFSPDSELLLFSADGAGISAEPVSVANQFQPYGELFSCKLDGSELLRWTHNGYEDGTPCWGPIRIDPLFISDEGQELNPHFQDCLWLDTVTEKMKTAPEH